MKHAVTFIAIILGLSFSGNAIASSACPNVKVTAGGGTAVFEARSITARGASCRAARKLAHDVGRHVLKAVNPPGGKYDACMLTTRRCSADGFACRGHTARRPPYALTEACTRASATVRWREFDSDYA
jgi:hypothetical protein